jgi:hypothetical protein
LPATLVAVAIALANLAIAYFLAVPIPLSTLALALFVAVAIALAAISMLCNWKYFGTYLGYLPTIPTSSQCDTFQLIPVIF